MNTSRRLMWGCFLIVVGALMLIDRLDLFDFGAVIRTYWPLVLVGLGVWTLSGRRRLHTAGPRRASSVAGQISSTVTNETISESTVFGDVTVQVQCPTFQGGKASVVFGQCVVDLCGATLGEGDHLLEVDSIFGKVEVLVPSTMTVKANANCIIGSVKINGQKADGFFPQKEWTSPGFATSSSRLRIDGSVALGEVLITFVVR